MNLRQTQIKVEGESKEIRGVPPWRELLCWGWEGGAEPHFGGAQKATFILGGLSALINYKAESPSDGSSGRPTGNLLSNASEKK